MYFVCPSHSRRWFVWVGLLAWSVMTTWLGYQVTKMTANDHQDMMMMDVVQQQQRRRGQPALRTHFLDRAHLPFGGGGRRQTVERSSSSSPLFQNTSTWTDPSSRSYPQQEQQHERTTNQTKQPILFVHFHKSGGTAACHTMLDYSTTLQLTDPLGRPIVDASHNCNAQWAGPATDVRAWSSVTAPAVLTCDMVVGPYSTNPSTGEPHQRNNFVAIEVPLNQPTALPCPQARNFALMRHPIARVQSHMRVQEWSPELVLDMFAALSASRREAHGHRQGGPPVATSNPQQHQNHSSLGEPLEEHSSGGDSHHNPHERQPQAWSRALFQHGSSKAPFKAHPQNSHSNHDIWVSRLYPCINNMVIRQLLGLERFLDPRPITQQDWNRARDIVNQFQVFVPTEQQQHPLVLQLLQDQLPEYHQALVRKQALHEKARSSQIHGTTTTTTTMTHAPPRTMATRLHPTTRTNPLPGALQTRLQERQRQQRRQPISYHPSPELLQLLYQENEYDLMLYEYVHERLGLGPWIDPWKQYLVTNTSATITTTSATNPSTTTTVSS